MSASRVRYTGLDGFTLDERKSALEALLPTIERLRGRREVEWEGGDQNEDGSFNVRYPIYDRDTQRVMEVCNGGALTDFEYRRTLERHGGPGLGVEAPDFAELARHSHEDLIIALLTLMMRSERFSCGDVAAALENGALVALLDRLRVLYEL